MSPGPRVLRSKVLADKGLVNRPCPKSFIQNALYVSFLGLPLLSPFSCPMKMATNKGQSRDDTCKECFMRPRGTSLIGKSVRDFFRTKGFIRIFDGFFLKAKGFLPKVYEIFWE